MKRFLRWVDGLDPVPVVCFAIAILLPCLAISATTTVACGPSMPTPAEQARVGTYGAELGACVELAATLDESKACRAKVSAKYGRDGGS